MADPSADPYLANLSHLPADIAAAIADFDQRVADGDISYRRSGFDCYADNELGELWVGDWLASHLPQGDVSGRVTEQAQHRDGSARHSRRILPVVAVLAAEVVRPVA
jgi:hypothetical protein